MKINKSQYLVLVLVMVFILMSATSYAQMGDIGFEDDGGGDEAVVPISGLITLGLAVGGFLGIRQIKKQD
jgi:hypothetical protein